MFGTLPFYRNYNPYHPSSFYQSLPQSYYPSASGYPPYYNQRSASLDRARALAEQRARRAQWLPDEYDDEDDYDYHRLSPHERAYLNVHRNQTLLEREHQRREMEIAEARKQDLQEQKWQQELDRRQKEDGAARSRVEEERERRRQQQQQQKMSVPSGEPPSRTIPISMTDGRIPSPKPQTEQNVERPPTFPEQQSPPQSTPPAPQYDEKHAEAASTIQRYFRIHKSIRLIQSLTSEFDALRHDFTYPSTISFQNPGSSLSFDIPSVSPATLANSNTDDSLDLNSTVTIPKLVFNSTNYALHAYNEALDRLLVKLDGVESWGDPDVRKRRRGAVKQIEREQSLVDRFWRISWLKHNQEQGEWVDVDMPVVGEAQEL